jgi:hypothetical protein
MSLVVVGAVLVIGAQGASLAATPGSPTTAVRQSVTTVDPSTTITSDDASLSNQPEKDEPDSDTNSSTGD